MIQNQLSFYHTLLVLLKYFVLNFNTFYSIPNLFFQHHSIEAISHDITWPWFYPSLLYLFLRPQWSFASWETLYLTQLIFSFLVQDFFSFAETLRVHTISKISQPYLIQRFTFLRYWSQTDFQVSFFLVARHWARFLKVSFLRSICLCSKYCFQFVTIQVVAFCNFSFPIWALRWFLWFFF